MPATIKDIARKVGVNPSTVSRVINGTASISEETRNKINEAMKELDYHPNVLARSLVSGSTSTIGLVIDAGNEDAFTNAFFIQSVSAIEFAAQKKGFNVLITNNANCEEGSNPIKDLVLEHKIDGIILPVSSMNEEIINFLIQNEFPFVVLGEPDNKDERILWVDMDNEQGGFFAVEHLISQGYKNPVMFVENKGTVFEKKRIQGFEKGLTHYSIEANKKRIYECGNRYEDIENSIKKLLEDKNDSIICTNNVVAYHVLRSLRKHGIIVPYDMGVITFDNYPLAEYLEPPLSVVDVDTYKMGVEAANVLFKKMKRGKGDAINKLVPTKMIARKSTKK